MKLTLLGTSSDRGDCPSVYATTEGTLVVQGWKITDPEALAAMGMPAHETAVRFRAPCCRSSRRRTHDRTPHRRGLVPAFPNV